MTNVNREYMANRVLAASPMELVKILYETAVDSVNKAIFYLETGQILERGNAITKAVEAISELRAALRPVEDSDYSKNLEALYAYMQRQLMKAHMEKSAPILSEVSRLLTVLLEGWSEAMKSQEKSAGSEAPTVAGRGPMMPESMAYLQSSQTVLESGRSWQF